MEIYVIRHGQTLFNYLERVQGWSDSPLTEKGLEECEALGKYMSSVPLDAIFSSDLKRAADTAECIRKNQKSDDLFVQETELLREAYFGGFEGGSEKGPWSAIYEKYGVPVEEIDHNFKESLKAIFETHKVTNKESRDMIAAHDEMGLAENYEEYSKRIHQFLEQVKELKDLDKIAIVSHGGTTKMILELLLDDISELGEVDNSSTSIIEMREEGNELVSYNDISYLE